MIINALKEEEQVAKNDLRFKTMIPIAIATSMDALAVGVTFAFLKVSIILSSMIIGIITFIICFIGQIVGNVFGSKLGEKAEMLGGIILIIFGIKALLH